MTLASLRQVFLVSIACSLLSCTNNSILEVKKTEGNTKIINFPERWTYNQDGSIFAISDGVFLAQKSDDLTANKFTITVKNEKFFSESVYTVQPLLSESLLTKVASSVWQINKPKISYTAYDWLISGDSCKSAKNTVFYKDRKFSSEGKTAASPSCFPSPDGTRLAIFSFTTSGETSPSFWGDKPSQEDSTQIEAFIEIYDLVSGNRISYCHFSNQQMGPSTLFSKAVWVESDYLLVPLNGELTVCFLAILKG